MEPPIVGITTYGRHDTILNTIHYSAWYAVPAPYVDAVRRAGGIPILLPSGENNWAAIIHMVDAVIVIGGGDLHPDYYGGNHEHPELGRIDRERDESEISLLTLLITKKQLPTLCICRGMQIANVVLGGTLHEDILDIMAEDIHRGADKGWTMQPVKVDAASLLAKTMGTTAVSPASGHHQAVKDLGEGLQVTAVAPDGIIEALELPAHPWFVCVQWHPEVSAADDPTQQRLFDTLVQRARKR